MTLDQLLQDPIQTANLSQFWLLFDPTLNNRLMEVQPHYQHQLSPIELTDGRFALCADLLSEISGLYAKTFDALDKSTFSSVYVVPFSDIEPLLPKSEQEP